MKLNLSFSLTFLLTLILIFILPAIACSLSDLTSSENSSQETKLEAGVIATLTANSRTLASQVSLTPLLTPTLILTLIPSPSRTSAPKSTKIPKVNTPTLTGPWIGEITFAKNVTDDNSPIGAAEVFSKGLKRVYAIFPYSGIKKGMKYTVYWIVNGKEFVSAIHTWKWGSSGTHSTYTYYTNNSDLDVGTWKFTIYVENELMSSGTFKIVP